MQTQCCFHSLPPLIMSVGHSLIIKRCHCLYRMLASSGLGAGARHVWKYGRPSPAGCEDVTAPRRQNGRRSSDASCTAQLRRPLHHSLQLQHVPHQVASPLSYQHHTDPRTHQHTGTLLIHDFQLFLSANLLLTPTVIT